MGQILEQFGEEFTITSKRLGWYFGQWKKNGGWTVMLRSIDKVDFVFCTLIPKTNGEFDPFSGVLEQTWYASLQGQIMEVCADGIKQLLETRKSRYDSIPKVEKGSEILVKNEDGTFAKYTVESLRRFEEGICIQYSGKFSSDEYVLLDEYKELWKLANEEILNL